MTILNLCQEIRFQKENIPDKQEKGEKEIKEPSEDIAIESVDMR